MKAPNISTGTGKTIVELCSALKSQHSRRIGQHPLRNAVECLEVSQLQRDRVRLNHVRGLLERARRFLLSFSGDHLKLALVSWAYC